MDTAQLIEFYLDSGIDTMMHDTPVNHFDSSCGLKNAASEEEPVTTSNINDKSNQKTRVPAKTKAVPLPPRPLELISHAQQLAQNASNLDELKQALLTFDGCLLKKTAINTVVFDGNKEACIMVIGEAPGADEDRNGIPFCGVSGALLDQMFNSIGLSRTKNIFITNSIFWRPPGNRRPTREEIQICRPFLERQIELLAPELLILVGATALNTVLNTSKTISNSRGVFFTYEHAEAKLRIASTAIFHPSYLLRAPIQKKKAWFDLLKIKAFIEENIADI